MAKVAAQTMLRWLVLGLGGFVLWQGGSHFFAERARPERLVNQLWLERMPRGPRDMIWHVVPLEHDGRRVGALGRASRWRVASDGFLWEQRGDVFVIRTPQNGCRIEAKARTWKCGGSAPRPFDLCLELESGGKRYRYFSREDWKIRPGKELPAEATELAGALPAALALRAEPSEAEAAEAEGTATTCPDLGDAVP
jgi:hypothetical protein